MSFASSSIKRALLTTTRTRLAPLITTTTRLPIQPLFHPTNTITTPISQQHHPRLYATMGKGVHNLESKKAFDEAVAEKGLLVLDCFATWCGPCKVIAPQVVKFSEQYSDARFYKLDVDEVPDVAQELSVRAMPTFMLFKDGEKVGEVVGANPVALETAIKKHL